MLGDSFWSRFSHALGSTGLRLVSKVNVPVYRLSGGRLANRVSKAPVLLLTTTGRKSGERRTAPVVYLEDGDRFVVINTNAGNQRIPAWSLNLKADPLAEVEVGRRRIPVRARIADGDERAELWRSHMRQYTGWDYYAGKLNREISVFVLEPR